MNSFDWDRSVEDLLTETRLAVSDIFEGTQYVIIRNPTNGEQMNNIYLQGKSGREAFVMAHPSTRTFRIVFKTDYLPVIQASGAKLGELKEIRKDRYPNWRVYTDLDLSDLRLVLSAFVKHS